MKVIGKWVGMAVVSMALTIGSGAMVWAGDGMYRNYGQVRAGWNTFSGNLDDADYGNGADLSVAYGRYLTPYLVVEGGFDLFGANNTIHDSTPEAGRYERKDTVLVTALLGTIKGVYPVGPLTFSGGGGVGGYFVTLYSDIDTAKLGDLDENTYDTVFGAHVVAGVDYDFTRRFFAGVQGLYRWTEDVEIDESTGSIPVRMEGNLNGGSLMLTFGYRF